MVWPQIPANINCFHLRTAIQTNLQLKSINSNILTGGKWGSTAYKRMFFAPSFSFFCQSAQSNTRHNLINSTPQNQVFSTKEGNPGTLRTIPKKSCNPVNDDFFSFEVPRDILPALQSARASNIRIPFSSPEPPFLLVTWSTKRRALVAAITGCPQITDIR